LAQHAQQILKPLIINKLHVAKQTQQTKTLRFFFGHFHKSATNGQNATETQRKRNVFATFLQRQKTVDNQ
jgi:hypothetical protein